MWGCGAFVLFSVKFSDWQHVVSTYACGRSSSAIASRIASPLACDLGSDKAYILVSDRVAFRVHPLNARYIEVISFPHSCNTIARFTIEKCVNLNSAHIQ
jgi:hypothetical protein